MTDSLFSFSNSPVRSLKKICTVTCCWGETKFNFWVGKRRIIHEQISSKWYDLLNFGLWFIFMYSCYLVRFCQPQLDHEWDHFNSAPKLWPDQGLKVFKKSFGASLWFEKEYCMLVVHTNNIKLNYWMIWQRTFLPNNSQCQPLWCWHCPGSGTQPLGYGVCSLFLRARCFQRGSVDLGGRVQRKGVCHIYNSS